MPDQSDQYQRRKSKKKTNCAVLAHQEIKIFFKTSFKTLAEVLLSEDWIEKWNPSSAIL
jgi:hypothetical protein